MGQITGEAIRVSDLNDLIGKDRKIKNLKP